MIPIRVDVGPAATLLDVLTTPSGIGWVDVSCDVLLPERVTCRRGRSGQSETVAAGSAAFTLDNPDGRWTRPDLLADHLAALAAAQSVTITGMAAAPTLRDMPVRITYGIPAGSAQALWAGVVTAVRASWAGGVRGVVDVTCADGVAQLNRTPMRSLPVQVSLAHGAVACWPISEDEGPAYCAAGGRPLRLEVVGSGFAPTDFQWGYGVAPGSRSWQPEAGAGGWLATGSVSGFALDTGIDASGSMPSMLHDGTTAAGGTLHLMLAPDTPGRAMSAVAVESPGGGVVTIGVDSLGRPEVSVSDGHGTAPLALASADPVTAGMWHHVAVTLEWDLLGIGVALWVDGVQVDAGSSSVLLERYYGARQVRVGAALATWVPQCWRGLIADVAMHDEVLADAVIEDMAEGRHGWTGDVSTVRALRIARAALRAPDLADASTDGLSTMCQSHTDGQTAGSALSDAATAEGSGWWTTRQGFLRLGSRADQWGTPVALTFNATDLEQGVDFSHDADGRVTAVTANRPGGGRVVRRSGAAAAGVVYERDVTLLVDSDPQLEAWADRALAAPDLPRSETITVDLVTAAPILTEATVLATDVGDVIEVTGLPASAPADDLRLLIVGVSDTVGPSSWVRAFNAVPADQYVDYWRLDMSELNTETVPAP